MGLDFQDELEDRLDDGTFPAEDGRVSVDKALFVGAATDVLDDPASIDRLVRKYPVEDRDDIRETLQGATQTDQWYEVAFDGEYGHTLVSYSYRGLDDLSAAAEINNETGEIAWASISLD